MLWMQLNLWIENFVLLNNIHEDYKDQSFSVNHELFIEMYIYGLASQALSLISLIKKFNSKELYTGIVIKSKEDVSITIVKYHPAIYFNTAITGNQNIQM